jgi:hypothetical protein
MEKNLSLLLKQNLVKNIFLLIAFLASFLVKAVEGDTTVVYVHQNVDMTWYANYDRVGVFPTDSTKVYRKVWMHYTMGSQQEVVVIGIIQHKCF